MRAGRQVLGQRGRRRCLDAPQPAPHLLLRLPKDKSEQGARRWVLRGDGPVGQDGRTRVHVWLSHVRACPPTHTRARTCVQSIWADNRVQKLKQYNGPRLSAASPLPGLATTAGGAHAARICTATPDRCTHESWRRRPATAPPPPPGPRPCPSPRAPISSWATCIGTRPTTGSPSPPPPSHEDVLSRARPPPLP